MVRDASHKKSIANLFRSLTSGDSSKINPNKFLNDQINCVPYLPTREMNRSDFEVKERIGEGNFGTVFKGVATGLYYPNSKTDVAIKTIHKRIVRGQGARILICSKLQAQRTVYSTMDLIFILT